MNIVESKILDSSGKPFVKSVGWPPEFGHVDRFGRVNKPSRSQLVEEYAGVAYACGQKNVEAILRNDIKLMRISNGSGTKRYRTRSLCKQEAVAYTKSARIRLADNQRVEEVVSHPALDVLYEPNEQADYSILWEYTQAYQEVCGAAYWLLVNDGLGRPGKIYVFQSQYLRTLTDSKGRIQGYEYDGKKYSPDEVVPFLLPNLINRNDGQSPLATAWESLNIEKLYMATESAMLMNEGRPDAVISFDEGISAADARAYEKWWQAKFQQGGAGGVIVLNEKGSITPLTYNPHDLARLSVHENASLAIARASGVPYPLISNTPATQYGVHATLRLQHWEDGVVPRLRRNLGVLNRLFLPHFDDGGTLFFAVDMSPPADREQKLREVDILVKANVLKPNEARAEYGYEAEPWGEMPAGMYNQAVSAPEATMETTAIPEATEQEVQTAPEQTLNGAQIASASAIVEQVATGIIPRDSGIGQLRVLLNLSPEQAELIMGSVGTDAFQPKPQVQPFAPAPEPEAEVKSCSCGNCKILGPDGQPITKVATKAKGHNRRIPEGEQLAKLLKDFFSEQKAEVLKKLAGKKSSALPDKFTPMKDWDLRLYERCRPVLKITWEDAYKSKAEKLGEVGADPDRFDVTNPKLQETINKTIYEFAESTNATTTLDINEALKKLREGFEEGLLEGNRLHELEKMVGTIFERADKERAYLISQTESSRAHHEAERQAAKDSGVVKGFELLLSSDACDTCQRILKENGRIGLDDVFFVDDKAPASYQERMVPLHPGCRCSFTDIIDVE